MIGDEFLKKQMGYYRLGLFVAEASLWSVYLICALYIISVFV